MQKAEKRGIIKVFYIGREIAIGNKFFEVRIDFVVCLSVCEMFRNILVFLCFNTVD